MPLGTEVGLGPGHIVLDGNPAPPRKAAQQPPQLFRPMSILWPKGWMDQDITWYGGRPQPRRHCIRWGPSSPHGKGHSSHSCTSRHTLLWHGRRSQQLLGSYQLDARYDRGGESLQSSTKRARNTYATENAFRLFVEFFTIY